MGLSIYYIKISRYGFDVSLKSFEPVMSTTFEAFMISMSK